jgi:EmrB/QacA subfamily drug resistance transporter
MMSLVRPPSDVGVLSSAPDTPGCASHAKRWVIIATVLGSSIAFLEASVINVALPALQDAFAASVSEMQWVASAYTLCLAALTLTGGAAGDRFGRHRLFIWGIAVLAVASLLCGMATTATQLIVGRAVQGLGAAMLVPNSLALLSGSFPKAERGRVIGIWSACTALTGAAGPILGGWVVDQLSWRAAFLAVVPLAVVTLGVALWRVPEPPRRRDPAVVDWWGGLLATVGLGGLVFAVIASGDSTVQPWLLIASALGGAVAVVGLVALERRSPAPMIPFTVFRSPAFRAVNLLTLLLYFAVTAVFFVLPFNLIQVQGYSATLTGAAYLPFAVLVAGLSPWIGALTDRIGVKALLVVGPAIAAFGLALFALPGIGGGYWATFFVPMAIVGLGMALTITPLTTTVMSTVTVAEGGVASAVNNTVARVATLLAVAVIGLVTVPLFTQALRQRLDALPVEPALRQALLAEGHNLADVALPESLDGGQRAVLELAVGEAFVDSFRWVALIGAACALTGAAAVLLLIGTAAASETSEGDASMPTCTHLDQIADVQPHTRGCEECLRSGDSWVHLRLCLSCGHVGCCDSSKNRHATKHFWAQRHPIVRSLEPGEDWRWCYVDEAVV